MKLSFTKNTTSRCLLSLSLLLSSYIQIGQSDLVRSIADVGSHHKLKQCRHGIFLYNIKDSFIGRSLDLYGEWGENEFLLFSKFVQQGQTVIDVGANIGTFTVPLAKKVGPSGTVHAFEAQRVVSQLLSANIALNEQKNVVVYNNVVGSGDKETFDVPMVNYEVEANFGAVAIDPETFDWKDVGLVEKVNQVRLDEEFYVTGKKCPSFIKIDVEGMELKVLQGAMKILKECRPVMYIENNCEKTSEELIKFIDSFGIYFCHWDVHSYFRAQNYAESMSSVFPELAYSINMICYPKDMDVSNLPSLTNFTKIDTSKEKYLLKEYNLAFPGKKFVLMQLGTCN